MRIIVFFDLPVMSPSERKSASKFRKFLLDDGYYMLQYSVYIRICNGQDAVKKHKERLKSHIPDNGSIRVLSVTEKQYSNIEVLLGNYHAEIEKKAEPAPKQLSFL